MGSQWPRFLLSTSTNFDRIKTSLSEPLPNFVQDSIPLCAQGCVLDALQQSFQQFCFDLSDENCLCTHYGTTGYTLGETALGCLHSGSCGSEALGNAISIYDICSANPNSATPTHSIITITPSPTSTGSQTYTTPYTRSTVAMSSGSNAPLGTSTTGLHQNSSATSLSAVQSTPVPLTTAQIAGIAIASIALLVVIIAVGVCLFCLRQQNKRVNRKDDRSFCPDQKSSPSTYSTPQFRMEDSRDRIEGMGFSSVDQVTYSDSQHWPRYYRISPPPVGFAFPATAQQMRSNLPRDPDIPQEGKRDSASRLPASSDQNLHSSSPAQTIQYIPPPPPPPPPPARSSQRIQRLPEYVPHLFREQQHRMATQRSSISPDMSESHYRPAPLRPMRPAHLTIQIPNLPSKTPPLKTSSPPAQERGRKEAPRTPPHRLSTSKGVSLESISQAASANSQDMKVRVLPHRSAKRLHRRLVVDSDHESVTSIDSNGNGSDDEQCTDGEDEKPLSTVEESPISKLRYPRVPRPSNSRSSASLRVRTSGSSVYSAPTSPGKGYEANQVPSRVPTPHRSPGRADGSKHAQWSPALRPRASPRSTPSPKHPSPSVGYRGVEDKLWRTEVSPITVTQIPYPEPIRAAGPYYSQSHIHYTSQSFQPQPTGLGIEQDYPIPQDATWRVHPESIQGKGPMSPFGPTPTLTPTKRGDELYLSVQR